METQRNESGVTSFVRYFTELPVPRAGVAKFTEQWNRNFARNKNYLFTHHDCPLFRDKTFLA
jgi:hypothetical protein